MQTWSENRKLSADVLIRSGHWNRWDSRHRDRRDGPGCRVGLSRSSSVSLSVDRLGGTASRRLVDGGESAITAVLANVPAKEIGAIGLSGQMHGAVVLDSEDKPVRPAMMWCDQRTAKECEEITESVGKTRLIDLVANPAVTGFTLPKLLWIRENERERWSIVRSVLLPKDYIRLKLSGVKASDVADSSGTLLFDVAKRTWSSEMLSTFGFDSELFPSTFESVEVTASVSKAGAEATGLAEGTLIVAGAGDNAAGAIGLGIVRPGMLSVTIGTSGVAFLVTDGPQKDPLGRIHTMCHAVAGRWHNTGVTQAAGLSLKWYRENFGNGRSFDDLIAVAESAPSGSDGLIWLPYLMGERTPHLDPNARAAWVGLTASHTEGHVVRSVLEGVAFSLRDSIEIFAELGTRATTIRLGGGGAKSSLWRKIQADVFGCAVETVRVDEGAAFGAAILAGVGAQHLVHRRRSLRLGNHDRGAAGAGRLVILGAGSKLFGVSRTL